MKNIVVVENNHEYVKSISNALSELTDWNIAGVGHDGYDAIKLIDKIQPDIAIVSFYIPLLNGVDLCNSIQTRSNSTAIIMMFDRTDDKIIREFFFVNGRNNKISGFVLKDKIETDICKAIRFIQRKEIFMSYKFLKRTINLISKNSGAKLKNNEKSILQKSDEKSGVKENYKCNKSLYVSKTEFKVTCFIGSGFSNKEIADFMHIKEATVRNYISLILQKTGLENRTQIALYAINNNFLNSKKITKQKSKLSKSELSKIRRDEFTRPKGLGIEKTDLYVKRCQKYFDFAIDTKINYGV
ncbi:MAG: response regulator transcription factor [Termitinemataceae bacterium]|nr:MAG: response regulator transcription factor [Termitinemataceae bacterium]